VNKQGSDTRRFGETGAVCLDWLPNARTFWCDEDGPEPEPSTTPMLDAALVYAANGWAVFPLDGKDPLTPHGFKDATTDEKQIRAWWKRWPSANIGWALPVGWWALDVDAGKSGYESLRELEAKNAPPPFTLRQTTGSDGEHWIFIQNPDQDIRQGAGFAPGLDTRVGGRGYLVVAPSVHPTTGKRYRWHTVIAPIEAPGWLVALVRRDVKQASPFVPKPRPAPTADGTYARLRDGAWGVRLTGVASPGDVVRVRREGGTTTEEMLTRIARTLNVDGARVDLWEIDGRRRYAQAVLRQLVEEVATAVKGGKAGTGRNDRLNYAWWRIGKFADVIPKSEAHDALLDAAIRVGLDESEAKKVLR
jgi:hypothetical protein